MAKIDLKEGLDKLKDKKIGTFSQNKDLPNPFAKPRPAGFIQKPPQQPTIKRSLLPQPSRKRNMGPIKNPTVAPATFKDTPTVNVVSAPTEAPIDPLPPPPPIKASAVFRGGCNGGVLKGDLAGMKSHEIEQALKNTPKIFEPRVDIKVKGFSTAPPPSLDRSRNLNAEALSKGNPLLPFGRLPISSPPHEARIPTLKTVPPTYSDTPVAESRVNNRVEASKTPLPPYSDIPKNKLPKGKPLLAFKSFPISQSISTPPIPSAPDQGSNLQTTPSGPPPKPVPTEQSSVVKPNINNSSSLEEPSFVLSIVGVPVPMPSLSVAILEKSSEKVLPSRKGQSPPAFGRLPISNHRSKPQNNIKGAQVTNNQSAPSNHPPKTFSPTITLEKSRILEAKTKASSSSGGNFVESTILTTSPALSIPRKLSSTKLPLRDLPKSPRNNTQIAATPPGLASGSGDKAKPSKSQLSVVGNLDKAELKKKQLLLNTKCQPLSNLPNVKRDTDQFSESVFEGLLVAGPQILTKDDGFTQSLNFNADSSRTSQVIPRILPLLATSTTEASGLVHDDMPSESELLTRLPTQKQQKDKPIEQSLSDVENSMKEVIRNPKVPSIESVLNPLEGTLLSTPAATTRVSNLKPEKVPTQALPTITSTHQVLPRSVQVSVLKVSIVDPPAVGRKHLLGPTPFIQHPTSVKSLENTDLSSLSQSSRENDSKSEGSKIRNTKPRSTTTIKCPPNAHPSPPTTPTSKPLSSKVSSAAFGNKQLLGPQPYVQRPEFSASVRRLTNNRYSFAGPPPTIDLPMLPSRARDGVRRIDIMRNLKDKPSTLMKKEQLSLIEPPAFSSKLEQSKSLNIEDIIQQNENLQAEVTGLRMLVAELSSPGANSLERLPLAQVSFSPEKEKDPKTVAKEPEKHTKPKEQVKNTSPDVINAGVSKLKQFFRSSN